MNHQYTGMEFVPVRQQRPFAGVEPHSFSALGLPPFQNNVRRLNELSNLPDLEITPVLTPPTSTQARNIQPIYGESSSTDAEWKNLLKEQKDIQNLLQRLPVLNYYFQLYNKIGEGTFSTVYLATLKGDPSNNKYAVKHLTHQCEQSRIERELSCMTIIGGKDNVVTAEMHLHNNDGCVTFIMPYLPHKKFNEYVTDMDVDETRLYMKNLLIALRRVHSFNVIHRDVKPGNFLYNREKKEFLLVDFGLAQIIDPSKYEKTKETDENTPSFQGSLKRKRTNSDEEATPLKREAKRIALKSRDNNVQMSSVAPRNVNNFVSPQVPIENTAAALPSFKAQEMQSPVKPLPSKNSVEKTPSKPRVFNTSSCPSSSRKKLFYEETATSSNDSCKSVNHKRLSLGTSVMKTQMEMKLSTTMDSTVKDKCFTPIASKSPLGSFVQVKNSRVVRQQDMPKASKSSNVFQKPSPVLSMTNFCPCSGKGAVCSTCVVKKKMVAPRAGTPGFRPPEVLFKYPHQTTAVDMWAAGVVMLCILSGCYPFFKSPSDLAGLAEMITIFGTEPITRIAATFGRKLVSSHNRKSLDLKKLCIRLRARGKNRTGRKQSSSTLRCKDCLQAITEDGCLCPSENDGNKEMLSSSNLDQNNGFPDSAYHLLSRLLDLDPRTRITAAEALEHPFFTEV